MSREELMKKTKEELINTCVALQVIINELKNEKQELIKEIDSCKVDEFLHRNYLEMKKEVEMLREQEARNDFTIRELQQLLERYKHIVDRLGGETI